MISIGIRFPQRPSQSPSEIGSGPQSQSGLPLVMTATTSRFMSDRSGVRHPRPPEPSLPQDVPSRQAFVGPLEVEDGLAAGTLGGIQLPIGDVFRVLVGKQEQHPLGAVAVGGGIGHGAIKVPPAGWRNRQTSLFEWDSGPRAPGALSSLGSHRCKRNSDSRSWNKAVPGRWW